ncbi:hypothetical protein Poli38472_014012 [Pythium oligandrum]|uniref:Tryptophan synthase beta chain-like PALP domain-containing protein n=1 Tax=Pythium oligandrum TaxID=41045 RepID=A0A8K1CNQ1_PYTOL|nr:hypothetical protein Poli38472_014012 [Pythium oligandrum]|eukprot:TMW66700.1 hypothetical protein Poli38472_014012 [Pythium oligandrum]
MVLRHGVTRLALPATCFAAGLAGGWHLQPTPTPTTDSVDSNRDKPVDLFDAVGNTPLLELKSVSQLTGCKIYAKAEYMNPCGSVKDRAAKYLILDAEARGELKPGSTLVEATGGNTGVSLALLGAARGYKTLFTMPLKTATEKIELMKVMGAQVHVQPMVSMFDKENHFYHKAQALTQTVDGAVNPNQFENTANMQAHYLTTGPEIWKQTRGTVDGFVCASGTAGTISGTSKFLKEVKPECAVWVVDPEEVAGLSKFVNDGQSTSEEKEGFAVIPTAQGSTVAEGVGLGRITPNFRHANVDKGIVGSNDEIVNMAYFLLKHDGVFVGPSAALNVVGAVKMARELGPGHTIVTILCDGGDRYRSKLYNPAWLKEQKLAPTIGDKFSLDFVKGLHLP